MLLTLREVFLSGTNQATLAAFSKIGSCGKMRYLKKMSPQLLKIPWNQALKDISGKAPEVLDLSIPEILVAAWKKYKILFEWLDYMKCPLGKEKKVDLVSHTIKSIHHPFLEIMVNGVKTQVIEFEIELSLVIHAITLKLQGGRLKEISAGNCRGELRVQCEECLIIDRATRPIEFLRPISLGEGIPLI